MGRQKKITDKEWDSKTGAHYDLTAKIQEVMDVYGVIQGNQNIYNTQMYDASEHEIEEEFYGGAKKKKEKKRKAARKTVNKPATESYTKIIDGESMLCFTYPTKKVEAEVGGGAEDNEDQEFMIRYDISQVGIEKMTDKFKMDNSVYPRANVDPEKYMGNRWEYETEVNKLAWRLSALNPETLYGKKGLLQRAVESYRNLNWSTSSRRVVRLKKLNEGTLRRRNLEAMPNMASVTWVLKGVQKKCRIRIDLESIDYEKIDADFRTRFSVFSGEFDDQSFGLGRWDNTNEDNLLAVKIAFLNVDNTAFWNAVKATDKVTMLTRAVEAYKKKSSYKEQTKGQEEEGPSLVSEMQQSGVYYIDNTAQGSSAYNEKQYYYYM